MSDNTKGDGTDNSDNEEHRDLSPDRSSPIHVPSSEHKLQYPYWLWFRRPGNGLRNTLQGYEQALKLVGQFASVEQWWALYSHLVRPSELPPDTSFNLFKYGIRPMWEDTANINGGKWVIRLRKGLAARAWEDLCMAMLGEQFMVGPEICGIVINIKFQEDIISVWHRTASDQVASARIRDTLRRVLHLQPGVSLEYKIHTKCLKASTASMLYGNPTGPSTSNYYPTGFHSSSNTSVRMNSLTADSTNVISSTANQSNADSTADSPTTNSSTPDIAVNSSTTHSSNAGSSTPESTGSLSAETTSTMSSAADSTTHKENEAS